MDCLKTVSELYMYISSVSLPVNEPHQTLVSLHQSILLYVGMITLFFFWGGGGCLVCLIVLVVKVLMTGFEAFGPPVNDLALGLSVVILDRASVVQIFKGVGASTVQCAVYKRFF